MTEYLMTNESLSNYDKTTCSPSFRHSAIRHSLVIGYFVIRHLSHPGGHIICLPPSK